MKRESQCAMRLVIVLLLLPALAAEATVRYVARDGSNRDGRSWSTAYRTLQDAIDDSAIGNGDEIRVKQGTYSLTGAVKVAKAVKIYGGFSGSGSTRNSETYITTIDGADETFCFEVTANASIDGLHFANGHAWGRIQRGGGVYLNNCSPTIAHCTFYRNHASYSGGGIGAQNATGAVIADCVFVENTANWYGGGIAMKNSNLTVTGCTFEANESNRIVEGWGGGGIFVEEGAPTIAECYFTHNTAYYGAGLCNYFAETQVRQCVFADCNETTVGGGGLINYAGSPRISDCLFSGNRVESIGGGILDKSTAVVVNCVLWDNSTLRYGAGIYVDSPEVDIVSAPQFTNCTIYGNTATRGGGVYSNNVSPTLTNCIVWNNKAHIGGPGIYSNTMLFNAKTLATYCDIQSDSTYLGTDNLCVDPGFAGAESGDFHLLFGSACIDAGDSSAAGLGGYDFDGKPRITDGDEDGRVVVDMGAFEFRGRMVSDYLHHAQIAQGRVYANPSDTTADYTFLLELQTGSNVSYIEFLTPAGYKYTISNTPHSGSAYVDTYHQVSGSTHIWTYMAEFGTATPLANYGDGTYAATVHYIDGTDHTASLWYGIPGSSKALSQPTRKPTVTNPTHGGGAGSPVTFTWNAYGGVNSICLAIINPDTGLDLVNDALSGSATRSNAYTLAEGTYKAELAFENAYEVTTTDGVPFSYGKGILMGYEFEVLYKAVYRFWSPVNGKHFYTLNEAERDNLIANYPDFWTYEGPVYHACATAINANLAPVYRFWSGRLGSHFYTIDKHERDKLINQFSYTWTYEGPVFYAYPEGKQPSDAKPVYRFWNASEGYHFYTMSEAERDKVINQYAHKFVLEGIAFYAYE